MARVFSQVFGVVAGLLEKDGKILLVREAQRNGPDDGKWNHPAGWIDVGEDPSEAVQREVLEESGHIFTPRYLLGIYSLVRKDIEKELGATPHAIKIIFIGDISRTQQRKLEDDVTEAKWFTQNEIYAMDHATLRDLDIKQMVKDYFAGKRFPLDYIVHTVVIK
ncbi:MAG: NUDIX hydrolase [Parcubacteria group bacterium Greene0416_79]|nr:MAG: NUDIX hydrolase [Parcubacteria group bacterium Greene0416_79]